MGRFAWSGRRLEQDLFEGPRQVDREEALFGIPVVLATLVHDAEITVRFGVSVADHAVQLPDLERRLVALLFSMTPQTAPQISSFSSSPQSLIQARDKALREAGALPARGFRACDSTSRASLAMPGAYPTGLPLRCSPSAPWHPLAERSVGHLARHFTEQQTRHGKERDSPKPIAPAMTAETNTSNPHNAPRSPSCRSRVSRSGRIG